MITTNQKTKSAPKELPPNWEWQHRDKRVPAFRAEKPWSNLRTMTFPTEAEAISAAHEIEAANQEGLAGLAGKGFVRPKEADGKEEDAMGFHPGFPPNFNPERAEQGLAQEIVREFEPDQARACRICGCTETDCRQCVEKTGEPCHWVEEDLCSACAPADPVAERLHKEAVARWRRAPGTSAEDATSNGYHPQMLQMIPVDQVAPSPTNPRKYFDEGKLQELADSIIEHGLVEPILVRPLRRTTTGALIGGDIGETLKAWPGLASNLYYELVAGERRWRATKLAGLTKIEAKVRDLDDQAALEIQMVENLQRDDLSPVEEADGYSAMLELKNEDGTSVYTVDSLAARIGKKGKSKSYVYGRLKLRNLPAAALEALAKGDLPATVGELIGRLPSEKIRQEFWDEEFEGYGSEWFEMPSFRDIKLEIERSYMRELKSAPFSQTDKKLLPEAGSCKDCPKRTGNNKAEYPDARADVCTDLPCYDRKVEAFNKRKLAEAAKAEGVRVLSPEESQEWFGHVSMITSAKTRDYIDLNEECDAAADPDDWEKPAPTYAELLADSVKVEVVGMDRNGQVHQLVSREAAETILKEKGIKLASPARTEADRKADQQKHKEEKQIRDQAANEICDRVVQSLRDNPFFLDSKVGNRDASGFLQAIALHLIGDADIARYVAKRRAMDWSIANGNHCAALHKTIPDLSEPGTIELIVEYMLAEELEWWIRSGELPWPLKRFPISEYFGHDPKKIEKRIAKEHAAAKKAKVKPKANAVATA
jgi:ParB/RepB/Spo0J family partition protein